MRRHILKTSSIIICSFIILVSITSIAAQTKLNDGYVTANGVKYYYEIHGKGEPLLLLHGGLGSIDMFEPDVKTLSENRAVIAVDLQGHGRTELGKRPIRYVDLGDDMAVILKHLK